MKIFNFINLFFIFYASPIYYLLISFGFPSYLTAFKDVFVVFLSFFAAFFIFTKKKVSYLLVIYVVYFSFLFIVSLYNYSDFSFYLVSFREILFAPLLCLIIGYYLSAIDYDFFGEIFKFLKFNIIIVFIFPIFFPALSYGLTGRMTSIYQGEHLPAIFSGLLILFYINHISVKRKATIIDFILIVMSISVIVSSASRSVLLAVVIGGGVYYLRYFKVKFFTIVKMVSALICLCVVYVYFSERDLLYNLSARIEQYNLALELIGHNPLLGIGVDKYGHLGSMSKVLTYKHHSTTTMDSSFIKYVVNTGVPIFVAGIIVVSLTLIKSKRARSERCLVLAILSFSAVMGAVTGKFGAYPINYMVYICIGLSCHYIRKADI
ncbi:O-antigen ligase family protein [Photobacterium swingsii]|uniref:O-antigen ligase family protein n=1 Tax=Photobacterium swingsii TaxID=680026 RepID=UPI0040697646